MYRDPNETMENSTWNTYVTVEVKLSVIVVVTVEVTSVTLRQLTDAGRFHFDQSVSLAAGGFAD